MRKADSIKKTKSIKKVEEYETIPEDRTRRKAIPPKDFGSDIGGNPHTRRTRAVLASQFRQSIKVCKLVIRKVKENYMLVAIVGLLTGVWLSGWFAQAGMRFESLLSAVVGVVVLIVIGMWSSKNE